MSFAAGGGTQLKFTKDHSRRSVAENLLARQLGENRG
jgi:hypothetical protein